MSLISNHTSGSVDNSSDTCNIRKQHPSPISEPLPALAVPTRDQVTEVHRTKRTKTVNVDDPDVQLASNKVSDVSGHPIRIDLRPSEEQFMEWLQTLKSLNKKCKNIPRDSVIKLSLAVIQAYNKGVIKPTERAIMIAALWIAIKFVGPRPASPNASFMSLALRIPMPKLISAEERLLKTIDWHIHKIACEAGVCTIGPDN